MILIPAIDLKDGHCVRLKQGDMDQATTFGEDPAAMARSWLEKGARRLHLVDLNGAFAGKPKNASAIASILKEVGDEMKRRLSKPMASTAGTGSTFTLTLPEKQIVNQVVLMEDITKGERVRAFVLEGKTKNGWKSIFTGSCIGHKFIYRFDDIDVSAIRLNILESKGEPQLLNILAFNISNN